MQNVNPNISNLSPQSQSENDTLNERSFKFNAVNFSENSPEKSGRNFQTID